jgi:hypothetical protein
MRCQPDKSAEVFARLSTAGVVMQWALGISLQTMTLRCRDVLKDFVLQITQ